MRRIPSHRRRAIAAVLLIGAAVAVPALPSPPAGAQSSGSAATRQVTFEDGSVGEVSVEKTEDLRHEVVRVSWSGFKPSTTRGGPLNLGRNLTNAHYPVAVFQCHHAAGEEPVRESCMTYALLGIRTVRPRLDIAEQLPAPEPTSLTVPFVDVGGQAYDFNPQDPSLPDQPDDWITFGTAAQFGLTRQDGAGALDFQVRTGDESPNSLGCGRSPSAGAPVTQCSLVVVPVRNMECDPTAPAVERLKCNENPNNIQLDNGRNVTVALSGSNWRHRFVFPLSFSPPEGFCPLTNTSRLQTMGSEPAGEAMYSWIPAICSGENAVPVSYSPGGENLARNLYAADQQDFALVSRPIAQADAGRPTAHAPVAISGFGVAFVMDNADLEQVTQLNLNARLVAKLLTQSYRGSIATAGTPYFGTFLPDQPRNLFQDPEFQHLNPHVQPPSYIVDGDNGDPMATLMLVSSDGDVPEAVTRWVAADVAAMDFLRGNPDPWGMRLNPTFEGWDVPREGFEWRDSFRIRSDDALVPQPYDPVARTCGGALCPYVGEILHDLMAQSNISMREIGGRALVNAQPLQTTRWVNNDTSVTLGRSAVQNPGQRAVIGIVDIATAARYRLPLANLSTGGRTQGGDQVFVGPTTATMFEAVRGGVLDDESGTIHIDYDEVAARAAYPGTMLSYGAVPTAGLNQTEAEGYARTIEYAAGPGQIYGLDQGKLPPGYLTLPRELQQHARDVAAAVRGQTGEVPQPPIDDPDELTPPAGASNPNPGPSNGGGPNGGDGGGGGAAPGDDPPASGSPSAPAADAQLAATRSEGAGWIMWALPAVLGLGLLAALAAPVAAVVGAQPEHPVRRFLAGVSGGVRRSLRWLRVSR
jgi:hypothetical protein